jgi:chemotaxis protein CheX
MDVRYINSFIQGVSTVFVTMVGSPVMIGRPFVRRPDMDAADVVAFIGISGDIVGTVSFALPMSTALRVARSFAQTEMPATDPQFADALGEVVNMIAGQAKSKFEGRDCAISLPRVIVGKEMKLLDPQREPVLVLPCDSSLGRFRLEVTVSQTRQPAAKAEAWGNEQSVARLADN